MVTKKGQLSDDELVYYTHPDGKVQEMTKAEADDLQKEHGGAIRTEADLIAPTGAPKR